MTFIARLLEQTIGQILAAGKSILLLGPRQTGKTTMLKHQVSADLNYTMLDAAVRRRFELQPESLISEIKAERLLYPHRQRLTVLIDEVQKVPMIMDTVQYAIDNQLATFILTGSSARKLKRGQDVNLLPGRVIELRMDGLSVLETPKVPLKLADLLIYGSLPEIVLQSDQGMKERLLTSYVSTYLEEEVRAEALVRNLAAFARFLRYAATESGKAVNMNKLAQEIGVGRQTIVEYYHLLEDCLVAERIEPLTMISTRRRLAKMPKYLLFDLGVRRIAAGEGFNFPQKYLGELFEQFVGLELIKLIHLVAPQARLHYWKDHNGPEVDFVLSYHQRYLPIEVKYSLRPSASDARHLQQFTQEYPLGNLPALIVCRSEQPMEIADGVLAINWRELPALVREQFFAEK